MGVSPVTPAVAADELPDQVLEFTLGGERYCLDIESVDEIVKPGALTVTPDTAPEVAGIMDLRGQTATLVDPAVPLGVEVESDNRQVIVFDRDDSGHVGWLVEYVHQVAELDADVVESVTDSEYVAGLVTGGDQFVIWLRPAAINDPIEP